MEVDVIIGFGIGGQSRSIRTTRGPRDALSGREDESAGNANRDLSPYLSQGSSGRQRNIYRDC